MATLFQGSPVSPVCVRTFWAADDFTPLPASTTHNPSGWPVTAGRVTQVPADLSGGSFFLLATSSLNVQ